MKLFGATENGRNGGYGDAAVPVMADDDQLDIRHLLLTLWRRKWLIITCSLVLAALATLVVSQIAPSYTAKAKVLFEEDRMNIIDIQEVLIRGDFTQDGLQNKIEIFRSTGLLNRVAERLKLNETPEFNAELRTGPPDLKERLGNLFGISAFISDTLADLGVINRPPLNARDEAEIAEQKRRALIERLRQELELNPVSDSRVIQIGYATGNPELSAAIVNTVADEYILGQLDAVLDATRSATDWLSGRVQELQDRVRKDEEAVERKRSELTLSAGQGSDITREQIQALSSNLAETRATASDLEARLARITEAMADRRDPGSVTEFRESDLIQRLRSQENALLEQEVSLKASVARGHPALRKLGDRLEQVRVNIREEAERIADAIANDLAAARAQEAGLVADLQSLEAKALDQSREELELRQLEREAQASRLLYENFLARQKETAEQQGLQTPDARILSPAEPPAMADAARKKLIILAAAIAGGLIGTGIVFLLESLNNTFRNPDELEAALGKGVLATIPRIGSRMRRGQVLDYLKKKPNSAFAESFRNLRTSILFSNLDSPPKVVMFTSSIPREGKSTSSTFVAMTSAQMGKSTIIIDCDLRMPTLAESLNVPTTKAGLLPLLEGKVEFEDALHIDEATGLHVLAVHGDGRKPVTNAADVLSSNRFSSLIQNLRKHYDLVILDTPPALVVADARIVASVCDAVVYTVKWDGTPRGAVTQGMHELDSVNAPVAGLVMTFVNEARASKYNYDGYQHYRGRYKDYYVS